MNLKYMNLIYGLFVITSLLFLGCNPSEHPSNGHSALRGQPQEELRETGNNLDESTPTLRLNQLSQEGAKTDFELLYHKRDGQVSPRTAELFISYSEQLEYIAAERGQALIVADKDLIIQKTTDGVLRVVIMSTTNLNHLDSGELARLSFQGPKNSQVFIQERRSYFAPVEANIGVTIEDTSIKTIQGEE